jgi:hypothetical protein
MVDTGGTRDFYSTGRPNGRAIATGTGGEDRPEDRHLHGLFIDTPTRVGWE